MDTPVDEAEDPTSVAENDPERTALGDQSQRFWTEFLDNYIKLDDPEQPKPRPARLGYISFPLPARTSWLTVYRGLHPAKSVRFLRGQRPFRSQILPKIARTFRADRDLSASSCPAPAFPERARIPFTSSLSDLTRCGSGR
jgi:hypothetical protein